MFFEHNHALSITLSNTRILAKIPGICRHQEKIPGIWMTPKKYLQHKILDPKNTTLASLSVYMQSVPPGHVLHLFAKYWCYNYYK